ncbi:MAG: hypothetical protein WCW16_00085 [Candidatus Magasanikbacteria bacterium]
MKKLWRVILGLILALCAAFIHIVAVSLFPTPFDSINIAFGILMLMITLRQSGAVVWIAFCLFSALNTYSSLPFGFLLFPGVVSILSVYWFYRDVFTNDSLWAIGALTMLGLIFFRLLYGMLVVISDFIVYWPSLFAYVGYEIMFTTMFTLIFYFVLKNFTKRHSLRASL